MRVHQAEFAGRGDGVVSTDVGVVVEVWGELRGCVGDVEGHFFVVVDCPVCGAVLFDDRFAGVFVMAGQECGYCR